MISFHCINDCVKAKVIEEMETRWVSARIVRLREHYPGHHQWWGENYTYGVVRCSGNLPYSRTDYVDGPVSGGSTYGALMWIGEECIDSNNEWLAWSVSGEDRRYTTGVSPDTYDEGERRTSSPRFA